MTLKPQPHQSKWTPDEVNFIEQSIANNKTLEEIKKVISLRSRGAILTKINGLGYGNYRNKQNGLTYFKNAINHKNRRSKDKSIPTKIKEDTRSIAKTAVNLASYEGSLNYILNSMKEYQCLHL